ncbi:unnamed protein product [Microthlaspi erraticum]|uniref:Reverse transcriptase zinc-binding domain-containing protein n=1 Tax=Microthlaspi erraticum TaxID=1685480 RepID=A0A6D2I9E9_9BRAS|nr:unnamed protein product [Microthlaspi erraticum]
MLNAFLWNGVSDSANGAKVSWEIVCTPKKARGLGIRRIAQINQVKLRDLARPFIVCQLVSGKNALFWHDNWSSLGPLIDLTIANGPRISGIHRFATVSQARVNNEWLLPRGRHSLLLLLRNCLPELHLNQNDSSPDLFLWKHNPALPQAQFSTRKVWSSLFPPGPSISRHKTVWFTHHIPKHGFLLWLAVRNRLLTRDRLRSWGLLVPADCLLCGNEEESRDHLLFSCTFSKEVWTSFFTHPSLNPPSTFGDIIQWVRTSFNQPKLQVICKLIFQGVTYAICAERNSRLHSSSSTSPKTSHSLVKEIQLLLLAKLAGLDRSNRAIQLERSSTSVTQVSFIHTWFEFIQM